MKRPRFTLESSCVITAMEPPGQPTLNSGGIFKYACTKAPCLGRHRRSIGSPSTIFSLGRQDGQGGLAKAMMPQGFAFLICIEPYFLSVKKTRYGCNSLILDKALSSATLPLHSSKNTARNFKQLHSGQCHRLGESQASFCRLWWRVLTQKSTSFHEDQRGPNHLTQHISCTDCFVYGQWWTNG